MVHRVRPWLYHAETTALCSTCLRRVEAKELLEDGRVFLQKRCPRHGTQRVLIADDAAYWLDARARFRKPGEQVARANTGFEHGCPYDCGICTEHEQHGCLTILEVTDRCNLRCPTCYASSGPERTTHRDLPTLERMLDRIVANEVEPDVVQISGGEPTEHPEFFAILDACKRRPIRHLMLNTNGIRIAQDRAFAERLASHAPGFEVYLQFDGLREATHRELRGADLREIRSRALDHLDALGLSTTLVVTLKAGLNDDELGDIIRFAVSRPAVRGVTFQPVQDAGRCEGFDPAVHRLTLTEVRRRILEQCDWFRPADIVPVPCHPDCLAMAYALRRPSGSAPITPLTGLVPPEVLVAGTRSTIAIERDEALRDAVFATFSTAHGPESAAGAFARLLCCLPDVKLGAGPPGGGLLDYRDVFRIVIMRFLDRHDLDVANARRSCVHVAHQDGRRIIPFDTFNVLYRDGLEREVLEPLRQRGEFR
ncbi:MAG: radical SAM protein [Planctomycetes bacterium]|nr:radical SAM protein [Planctomycetota bacterium]